MGVMWEYPDSVRAKWRMPSQQERDQSNRDLAVRHAETLARLEKQCAGNEALRKEKELALQWCRANGNPHRPKPIIMQIEGHDLRYTGDGWTWQKPLAGKVPSWDDMVRKPYDTKHCMTCGFTGPPEQPLRPCHEMWSDRTKLPSTDGKSVYWPDNGKGTI